MALKSHYDVEANYLEMIQQKLDTEVFGKPLEEVRREQRDMITLSYPTEQGLSLEETFKLGNWLFEEA
jgi:hypothetical protein